MLADDHEPMLATLSLLLNVDFHILGAVSDAERLVEEARRLKPRVVVVDFAMPKMNGIEAAKLLLQELDLAVIILTSHSDRALVRKAFAAGVRAFVLKNLADVDLPTAIRSAAKGESFVSEPLTWALE